MATKKVFPTKLTGSISWVFETVDDELGLPVKRALLRSTDEIVLDCETGGWQYSVSLKRSRGCRFEGAFHARHGNQMSAITAFCTLYSNEEGYMLFGRWFEDDYESTWWAELRAVKRFDDEKPDFKASPAASKPRKDGFQRTGGGRK